MTMNGTLEERVEDSMAAVHLLTLFIDYVVIIAPPFQFTHKSHELCLVVIRPAQDAIENLFHLASRHDASIPHRPFDATDATAT